ncbi:MAG: ferredoxin [Desulfobacterales bacterium CG07_land_8_20_14_0_80_52_14]|nr:MAG: ferredoxin [Desulfobacterales bacterium CG23_combo_of_CG06-09_8_20_14_all_52_9]PIU50508.1 MAG: ferredoxin [Desulfobacterales bacterium CG07_land_8_20_14_0_80_52_14]
MKIPVVELSECILCGVCVEVCPEVFLHNPADYIEVASLKYYPEEGVNEAIKNCPARCIFWDKG